MREDTGERVVALVGSGGYARVRASRRRSASSPIPDGVDDGTALALIIQGTTAWHLYRTAAHVATGESVVVHARRRRRRLAGGAARPCAWRRAA